MNSLDRSSVVCLLAVLALSPTSLYAQDSERPITRDKPVLNTYGALELGMSSEYNYELRDEDENIHSLEPVVAFGVEYDREEDLRMRLTLEYGREWTGGNRGREDEYESSFSLDEAFVELSDIARKGFFLDDVTLTLGRRKLSESREWFYDANVDGAILEAEITGMDTDLMVSFNREEWIGSDLLHHNEPDTVSNLILSLVHRPVKRVDIGAYAIVRNDSSEDNDSPRFIGLSARGRAFDKRLNFWADLATVSGQDGDKDIDGTGFDIGGTLKLLGADGPYVTLGYAFGSGDGDEDTDFRQTGLHGNSDRFGGVTSFKYYGELMDPELSNMKILTAGIGFRALGNMSIDMIYHRYEQDVALDQLRDSDLDRDPNGRATDLGAELDLVAGFDHRDNLHSEWVLGYFQPGAAFDNADDAVFIGAKLSYEF